MVSIVFYWLMALYLLDDKKCKLLQSESVCNTHRAMHSGHKIKYTNISSNPSAVTTGSTDTHGCKMGTGFLGGLGIEPLLTSLCIWTFVGGFHIFGNIDKHKWNCFLSFGCISKVWVVFSQELLQIAKILLTFHHMYCLVARKWLQSCGSFPSVSVFCCCCCFILVINLKIIWFSLVKQINVVQQSSCCCVYQQKLMFIS